MAQLIVRNLDDAVKASLTRRARRHGRSTEEEVREILRTAAGAGDKKPEALGSSLAALFKGIGLKTPIQEWKGQPVRSPRFK